MRILSLAAVLVAVGTAYSDDDPTRLFPDRSELKDARLRQPKDLNDYFPFTPPKTREGWNDRAQKVRTQVLVATGLWPMPEKTPLSPVIHGKIERDGFTVEKVFFASMPGHYVTGNLYRPTGGKGPYAGVLCPHGHWANGRFYAVPDATVKKQIEDKAEKKAAAKTPKRKEVEVVEKTNVRELRDYVINEGRKEFTIQRYKGLGEMTAPQLWETTMDPERRTLLSVKLEDIAECETIFTTLMGEDVEARRKFIEENALDVKNLDI